MSQAQDRKTFRSFEEGLKAIQQAACTDEINAVVNAMNNQFEAGHLEISPEQWGMLASAVLVLPQ